MRGSAGRVTLSCLIALTLVLAIASITLFIRRRASRAHARQPNVQLSIDIVFSHHKENLSWIRELENSDLAKHIRFYVIADTGASPLGDLPTDKIRLSTKPKKQSFFAHQYQYLADSFDELATWTFLMHGHDSAWHRKRGVEDTLRLLLSRAETEPGLRYLNVATAHHKFHHRFVRSILTKYGPEFKQRTGVDVVHKLAPKELCKNPIGAEALVHREVVWRRPKATWQAVADYCKNIAFKNIKEFFMEYAFDLVLYRDALGGCEGLAVEKRAQKKKGTNLPPT